MNLAEVFDIASGGLTEVADDWMSAAQVRSIIFDDPALIWLEYHGQKYGLQPEESPYDFLKFIGEKGRELQDKYASEVLTPAASVCKEAYEVRRAQKLKDTIDLMQRGVPVIYQPALWWAPERIYGVPDFLVLTSWLNEKFPTLLMPDEKQAVAPNLECAGRVGHYAVIDVKFTTKLEESQKAIDYANYKAQVRIYSYIVGCLQGLMAKRAFLVTRDHLFDPLAVDVVSSLGQPLDQDLAVIRERFVEIKTNGGRYTPWNDAIVASNLSHADERWDAAKNIMASEKVPGRDPELVYQITGTAKRELAGMGYPNLDSILKDDPAKVPLERCKGIGSKRAKQIRSLLGANRSRVPVVSSGVLVPKAKEFEFYVDFEYFTNVNVDFTAQWPTLQGCEMIFMVGLGWEEAGNWSFKSITSIAENQDEERKMFEAFLQFLGARTNSAFLDTSRAAFYHWTSAEVWQAARASDRHAFPQGHPLRNLPWCDLHKVFVEGPVALPGTWDFTLKHVAKALGEVDARFATTWPGDLDKGLRAMVMGWEAYRKERPLESQEMDILKPYLEADCKALWHILKWLRNL
jgi:uncharacterized protein